MDLLYKNERPEDLTPEEEILADLINHARGEDNCAIVNLTFF